MKFASLSYFNLIWLLIALVIFYIYVFKQNKKLLALWGDLPLVNKLINNVSIFKRKVKVVLLLCGVLFIILSLAQPQWGYHWEELKRKGIDIIIALDTSKSMLADDMKSRRTEI